MKEILHHDDIECHLYSESVSSERPYLFLDLGTAAGEANLRDPDGPRIACRRTDDGKGWRIVLHADDGDPFAIFDITDCDADKEPVITTIELSL